MTTPKEKFEPQDSPTPLSPLSDASTHWVNYERRPATDSLAVLGVGSAVLAFLLWAWPVNCFRSAGWLNCLDFFSDERLPAVVALLVLSFILLLLRRRN